MPNASPQILADVARLQALHATGLLDSPPDPSFDRLTRLAARVLHAPVALVSLVDDSRQFFKSCVGLSEPWMSARGTSLSHSFCQHVVATGQPLVINDAREHPLVRDNLAIADISVIAYAGMPLITPSGHTLGSFCVIDTKPKAWTEEDIAILRDLAASVMTEIELRAELVIRDGIQKELMAARDVAEEASRAKTTFLSQMSHELRTPLNSIIGFANILATNAKGTLAHAQVTYADRIRSNGVHLLTLISDLLDLSKIEAGRMTLNIQPTDLSGVVMQVMSQFSTVSAKPALVLRAEVPERLAAVHADPIRFAQVLINLMGNAVKFTERGTVTVQILADADGTPTQVTVVDTGIGIPADRLEAIFRPFEQAEANTTRRYGGTGLGLAISRELCQRMGFDLLVRSEPGHGSTFAVVIPRDLVA